MAPGDSTNGWAEHKALVEWRLKTNEEALGRIETQLVAVRTSLAEIQGDRKRKITTLNLLVPALVSIMVLAAEAALAHFWR